jgi:DNA-binding MarR family transcriptional regulator
VPRDTDVDLGWALFATVRRYRHLTDALLEEIPGGPRGYQVLVSAGFDDSRSQLALAQYLGVDRTVMTYLLDQLEGAGLVERRSDPADRRVRRIALTDAGVATLAAARRRLRSAETAMLEPLTSAQRRTFHQLLRQLAAADVSEQSAG